MELPDAPWLPASEESLGTLGLAVSLATAAVGTVWLVVYDGGVPSFALVALSALVGWVAFVLRWPWDPWRPSSG